MSRDTVRATIGSAALLAALALLDAAAAAQEPARPEMPGGGKELCLVCHDDVEMQFEGDVVHAPVAMDMCTSCHNPHASRHGKLLQKQGTALCLDCHDDLLDEMHRPIRHGALKDDRGCLSCHAPHAGSAAALLVDEPAVLCASCHEGVSGKLALSHTHAPAAAGECTTCHTPHAGQEVGLLHENAGELCRNCHDVSELATPHRRFALDEADCGSCHDPHGATASGLLRETVHAPFADDCEICHESPANPRQLVEQPPDLCVTCHSELSVASETDGINHPISDEVICTDCHSPHAGTGEAMIRGPERQACLGCHVEIRELIDGGKSNHPLEVEEGRCSACHRPHDAPGAPLLARPSSELCVGCHESHSAFTHPMGPNVADPSRPGKTVECISCHSPHASDEKKLLRASEERALCIRCHTQWE